MVFTNEIWRQVARQEITAAPLFSILCCSFYLYITLCMSAVNINAVRSCSHNAKLCLFWEKNCQHEAIFSANDFVHPRNFSQSQPNFKHAVDWVWRPWIFCQARKSFVPWHSSFTGSSWSQWIVHNTRRQFDKGHEWNASFPTMSSGDLQALMSKWLKKREKYKNTADGGTSGHCRSVLPWRCTTRFRPAVRLCQLEMVLRCFPIPCPRQDSEGEKSRPLDHMRQIPFVDTSVPPYISLHVILSSMWYVLRFEHAHGLKWYNDRRMTRGQTTWSLGGTASLGLLLPYFILTIFIAPSMDCWRC